MSAADNPLFTIGHSNHEMARFVDLLQRHKITSIADVRSQPYSQYTPQFNRETLENALRARQIHYVFMGAELGARRSERECYSAGQARYDRIATLPLFLKGLDRIRRGMISQRIALMCSEKDPLTCHRTILVCRHLRTPQITIQHILEDGSLESLAAAEERLLRTLGLPEGDLFHDRQEFVERAYDLQSQTIAYTEPDPPAAASPATTKAAP